MNQGQYHHLAIRVFDVNGDDNEELLLGGANNRLGNACFTILDPRDLRGCSPPWDHEYFIRSGLGRGRELAYVTVEQTQLGQMLSPVAIVAMFEPEAGRGYTLHVEECESYPHLYYHLDASFVCESVTFGDGFTERYTQHLSVAPPPDLTDSLAAGVTVWYRSPSF